MLCYHCLQNCFPENLKTFPKFRVPKQHAQQHVFENSLKTPMLPFKCLSNESMDTKYSPRKLIEEKCRFTVSLTSVAATSDGCCAGFFASSRRFMHDAGRRTQHSEEIDHLHHTRELQIAISLTAHTELIQRLEFSKSFANHTPSNRVFRFSGNQFCKQ